jgi:hypothetical protein
MLTSAPRVPPPRSGAKLDSAAQFGQLSAQIRHAKNRANRLSANDSNHREIRDHGLLQRQKHRTHLGVGNGIPSPVALKSRR